MIRIEPVPATGHAEPHRSWKPTTYTERRAFFAAFCDECRRSIGAGCFIKLRAMMHDPSHANFPSEWTLCDGAAVCTAFEPKRRA